MINFRCIYLDSIRPFYIESSAKLDGRPDGQTCRSPFKIVREECAIRRRSQNIIERLLNSNEHVRFFKTF
jgi:hypothetical protein